MSPHSPALNPELLQEALQEKIQAFSEPAAGVLLGQDSEAVHDMRVASRRLQEILKLVLPQSQDTDDLLKDIRKVRRLQADLRDFDVLIEYLQKRRQKSAPAEMKTGLDLILAHLESRRNAEHASVCKKLVKRNPAHLKLRITGAVAQVFQTGCDVTTIVETIHTQIAEREQGFQAACELARQTQTPDDLHNARIAGKKLRYILETADRLNVGRQKNRIRRLKTVQSRLGDWHDLEVLEEVLVDFCSSEGRIRAHPGAVRGLLALLLEGRRQKARYLKKFLNPTPPKETA